MPKGHVEITPSQTFCVNGLWTGSDVVAISDTEVEAAVEPNLLLVWLGTKLR